MMVPDGVRPQLQRTAIEVHFTLLEHELSSLKLENFTTNCLHLYAILGTHFTTKKNRNLGHDFVYSCRFAKPSIINVVNGSF